MMYRPIKRINTQRREAMDLFLANFADTLDQDAHAVMMLDGAGSQQGTSSSISLFYSF